VVVTSIPEDGFDSFVTLSLKLKAPLGRNLGADRLRA